MKRIYNMKKTISMRQFIAELGEGFSEHIKKRLLELGTRCVLTRKEINYRLDLKHIEHAQFETACDGENNSGICRKEYTFGQFIVVEEGLYFTEQCLESKEVMQHPVVSEIYNSLDAEGMIFDEDRNAKKINDANIDYVIDSILAVCPAVSQGHLDMVQGMISRSEK